MPRPAFASRPTAVSVASLAAALASLTAPGAVRAQTPGGFGCGAYICLTVETGSLDAAALGPAGASYAGWSGTFARARSAVALPTVLQLGARSFEWRVPVVGHYVGYCATGVVCDRDTFSDFLSGGFGVPARALDVFGAAPDMRRDWDVRVDAPVEFAAYDAAGRVVATDRFAAAVIVTPEPATLVLTVAGVAGVAIGGAGVVMRRRRG